MLLYLVTEDNGDGSTSVQVFKDKEEAKKYIEDNEEWTYGNEGSPTVIDTDTL